MKKFENIVIASDLDGTYLADRSKLVTRNIERVRYFCENGGHFTFATGRVPIFTKMAISNPGELINLPAVTGNGSCLYDFRNENPIWENFVDMEFVCELADTVKELAPQATFRGAGLKGFVVPGLENKYNLKEYRGFPDFMERRIMPMNEWNKLELYKVNVMGDADTLAMLYPILREKFSDKLTVTRSGYLAIEIMQHGTSKAVMLRKMVKEYFGDGVTLYAVGDQDNDLEMHSVADIAVCPSNANDAVKSICKYCLCDNNSGVIGDLIDLLDKQI